jgi:hypothetical protein
MLTYPQATPSSFPQDGETFSTADAFFDTCRQLLLASPFAIPTWRTKERHRLRAYCSARNAKMGSCSFSVVAKPVDSGGTRWVVDHAISRLEHSHLPRQQANVEDSEDEEEEESGEEDDLDESAGT